VDTTLIFAEKKEKIQEYHNSTVTVKVFNKKQNISAIEEPRRIFQVDTSYWYEQNAFNVQSNKDELSLIKKLEKDKLRLNLIADLFYGIKAYQVGKGIPPQTQEILDKKPFTSKSRLSDMWIPFYDGNHIGRYELFWKGKNWIHYGPWLAEPRKPQNFEGEKILIRKIVGQTLISMYIQETSYCNTLLFILKIKDKIYSYHYLLGVLNSKLIGWYFRKKFQISAEDTFPQILIRDINQFPIPSPKKHNVVNLNCLVGQLLDLHKQLSAAKSPQDKTVLQRQIETTDHQINRLVYELYGLTDEEIEIVEKA